MRRQDLGDLVAFVAIADTLSFRAAASRLGLTPSALSHIMRQLEDRMGVRLLHRTTRSVQPTDAGLRLLKRLRPAIEEINGAYNELGEEKGRPFGRLRISATPTAATAVIAPIWERFLETYPDVHLELQVDTAPIDIVAKGFDAGIGPRYWAPMDMTAVRVFAPIKVAIVGAPAYFARWGKPRVPEDLLHHQCVQLRRDGDGPLFEWPLDYDGKLVKMAVRGHVTVNNTDLTVRAAVDGLGLAYTILSQAALFLRSGQLIRVLEEWSPTFEGMFLYYPGGRQTPAALRALIDMIRSNEAETANERVMIPQFSEM